MNVLAAGRASEIVDLGEGRVLRRFKDGGNPAREAEIMEHARGHGLPVPRVLEVLDDALVLERIDGPTMLASLRRPRRMAQAARTLADLHARLHEIPFEDARLLHLDLHPDNVLLSSRGPVVALPEAAAFRLADPNVTDAERSRVRGLVEEVGP